MLELKSNGCKLKSQQKIQTYMIQDQQKLIPRNSQQQQDLLDLINNQKELSEINSKYPLINWVVYHNSIYDLTHFFHPGGDFLIEQCRGRDVARFLVGAYAIETNFQTLAPQTLTKSNNTFAILQNWRNIRQNTLVTT